MINLFHWHTEPFAPDATPFVADAAADDHIDLSTAWQAEEALHP